MVALLLTKSFLFKTLFISVLLNQPHHVFKKSPWMFNLYVFNNSFAAKTRETASMLIFRSLIPNLLIFFANRMPANTYVLL